MNNGSDCRTTFNKSQKIFFIYSACMLILPLISMIWLFAGISLINMGKRNIDLSYIVSQSSIDKADHITQYEIINSSLFTNSHDLSKDDTIRILKYYTNCRYTRCMAGKTARTQHVYIFKDENDNILFTITDMNKNAFVSINDNIYAIEQ